MNLKESILKSVKAGKYALIGEWCKNHNITNDIFKINSNYEIESTVKYPYVELDFSDYNELPDYIKFANSRRLCVDLESERKNHIKSFRGFPEECGSFLIDGYNDTIPELKMRCNGFRAISLKITKPFEMELYGSYPGTAVFEHCDIKNLKNLKITNCSNVKMHFCPFFDKIREEILDNSYINYNKPIDERSFSTATCVPKKVKKIIEKFFSKFLDFDKLRQFEFTYTKDGIDVSYLVEKYEDDWYLFKTRIR